MENKIGKLLLEPIDRDIEIILDNQVEIKFPFDLYGLCFHVYKDVWSPLIGKRGIGMFSWKEKNTYEFVIVMYRNDLSRRIIVGNALMNVSKVLVKFLQLPNSFLTCKVTGNPVNRGTSYGLKIPVSYTCTGCHVSKL